jgi:CRISPR-associated protein Cas6
MDATSVVDLVFALRGGPIEYDYAASLHAQLRVALPWLDAETDAGVFPLRGATAVDGKWLLGPRSKLVLRVPAARAGDCAALAGRSLALREPVQLGQARARALLPYRTLYSPLVVTGDAAEDRFLATVLRAVAAWNSMCQVVVGRAGTRRVDAGAMEGFSVMLHGVSPETSLRVQEQGLGAYRKFGCGLFLPHRSADAVGT